MNRRIAALLVIAGAVAVLGCRDFLFGGERADVPPPPAERRVAVVVSAQVDSVLLAEGLSDEEFSELDRAVDSLMLTIQEHGNDMGPVRRLAQIYIERGWFEEAIGPLALAVEREPGVTDHRRALDEALSRVGIAKESIIVRERAAGFLEAVEMWGHGC